MSTVSLIPEPDEMRDKVATLMMQGRTELSAAKELGIKRIEVINYYKQWQELLSRDSSARDMAHEHLNKMVKHYDHLIERYYKLLRELQEERFGHMVASQINSALKAIADLEDKRLKALQSAGLLDASDLGDELAEREEREAMLINILRNDLCDDCRMIVATKLQEVTNTVEATIVFEDEQ